MSLYYIAITFFGALTWTAAMAFPTQVDRAYRAKLDPFIALANTLREEDLQQQHRRPIHHPVQPEMDYETEDKLSDNPVELWQVRQLQHQMGQAAMMMPMFQREQRNWAYEMEEEPGRREDDYGIPVMSEEEGQLYRDNEEPVYTFYPQTPITRNNYLQEQREEEEEEKEKEKEEEEEEKRLLMDTLVQYMYLTGKDQVKRSDSGKDNREFGQKEVSTGSQQRNLLNSLKMPLMAQQQLEEEHITNSTTEDSKPAEDELIQELDTLKTGKN